MIKLINVLKKISKLLISVDETNWNKTFIYFINKEHIIKTENEKNFLLNKILKIYGGLGSFSDLVIYVEGQVMIKENIKLETFRKELFKITKSMY
ncbi:MAG: hypothetical protein OQL19_20515 [Gammaproteobacteria bacterium]|nr:hypothetical protein [Gammaproteobacteria bacterium]